MGEAGQRVSEQLTLIRDQNPALRALISTLDEQALRDAERLDTASGPRGPLHAMTVTLKDNIDVSGVVSTAGSAFQTVAAVADATVTGLLREAGAIILGKNNMAEFAMGVTGRNRAFGDCRNAWDPMRIPGGSSSGSAVAVAAGMATVSLGTDTGGSGRIPAAVNGIVGIRPTLGRVSCRGVLPVSTSFDTITPMARDVRTAAAVLTVLDHQDADDPASAGGRRIAVDALLGSEPIPFRVGVPDEFFFDEVDPGVLQTVRSAIGVLGELGCAREVRVPGARSAQERMIEIMYPEAAAAHADRIQHAPETIDPDVLRRLRIGMDIAAETTERAREWQAAYRRGLDAVFEIVDVIVTPTITMDVPLRDGVDLASSTREIARFTYAWSMYGGPSLSMPCGVHPSSGMPVGLQLSAAPWNEHVLLHIAERYERATGWTRHSRWA